MKYKRIYWIVSIASVAAVCVSAYALLSRETLATATVKGRQAIDLADGALLLDLMAGSERSAYGVSDQQMNRLLAEYVKPELSRWAEVGGMQQTFEPQTESLGSIYSFIRPDGGVAKLALVAARTDRGPKLVALPKLLLTSIASMKYQKRSSEPENVRVLRAVEQMCRQDAGKLQECGLHGFYEENPPRIITWSEYAESARRMLQRYEESLQGR